MPKSRKPLKWKDDYLFDVFELAKSGMRKQKIFRTLGIWPSTFYKWMKTKPAMRLAYVRGRRSRKSLETFKEYIYARLPKRLRRLWRKINAIDRKKNGLERIEALMADQGKAARQHLFLHAYITANFNATEACRMLCISRGTYEMWYKNDPDFHDLFDGMLKVKKDYFEGALVGKVNEGDTAAILFVNRTINRDRGYGNKIEVEHSGQIQHSIEVAPVKELNLDLDTLKSLYEAITERREQLVKLEGNGEAINGHAIER